MKNTKDNRILENTVAIALMAGSLISAGLICPENSSTFNELIIDLAKEFEEIHTDESIDGAYIEKIDNYALERLLDAFR